MAQIVDTRASCYHCGDACRNDAVAFAQKMFCCEGCRLVYEILSENDLGGYYCFNERPGVSPKNAGPEGRFGYLDDPAVRSKLVRFTDGNTTRVVLAIPAIHCSSCIWLLEHLHRVNEGIVRTQVHFGRKEADITFDENRITLRQLVETLARLGYEPRLVLNDLEKTEKQKDRSATYRIGIAGFCFGNIMLFSFPEYFSSGHIAEHGFRGMFSLLNFGLSLPVFFYCSLPFFRAAAHSLRQHFLNIDVPIALGILVMFVRSAWEILSATGPGYMDTMAGLVFFMLVGRAFQNKTYDTLSFDRDYTSFFPVSVMIRRRATETSIPVSDLRPGDRMILRNGELIPADAVLAAGDAHIDYSFVTGEAAPVSRKAGDLLYAGGRQKGAVIEAEVVRAVSQSYLTGLWNDNHYEDKNQKSRFQQLVDTISQSFTIVLLAVAISSLAFWLFRGDSARGWNAFTSVLIIACPCALAISSPFTLGNLLRLFGKNQFYLKNYTVIEKLARVDTVVFDKTGTLTRPDAGQVVFLGEPLNMDELCMVKSLVQPSSHPLSVLLYRHLEGKTVAAENFRETAGRGVSGDVFGVEVKIGSASFVGAGRNDGESSGVFVSIDGKLRGRFNIGNRYREHLPEMVAALRKKGYRLVVLSGDHQGERNNLLQLFGSATELRFSQSPPAKLRYILHLQRQGHNVLMVGDGLNDAGALRQSDAGITVSDDINNFSPACDGILDAGRLSTLPHILSVARDSHRIILGSFVLALLYNITGLYFAVGGNLSPVMAAILMPLSAATIISFTTGMSNAIARKRLRFQPDSHHRQP